MTEKRFQINNNMGFEDKIETFELSCVVDTDNKTFYFIVDDLANVEAFVERLNKLNDENEQLKQELQKIQDDFELNWTQNRMEFDKDKLYIKDTNTETCLDNRNLSIRVRIPSLNEYYLFKYKVTGRSLMKEFIEKYNSKGDDVE